ncbi:trans-aconitate methyltransferase [Orenia metallireducens]|uniref:Trans-aconitate methyltransferase n=1 Tax=Orenia metallireducens TaxID=1413210 RepID=A0A285GXE5_9FIRM|nr:trans-aconitate methyltransferase [Orenia metallireducens]SNY27974.1 Trans-aconitate methyltransferase [Orenia metallireducens]
MFVVKNFEFDGEKYKKASKHQKEWGRRLIGELDLKGDETILDLGCGDGVLTAQLAEAVPKGRVLGIDASLGMVKTATRLLKENLDFQVMDINQINFIEQFDLIFSNAALHWVKDHNNLLNNCFKALKPKGTIRFNFAADGNCSNYFGVIRRTIKEARYRRYFNGFEWPWYMPKVSHYEELIAGCKFSQIEVWEENADWNFPNSAELVKWIEHPSLVPFLEFIAEEDAESFRNIVIKRMLESTELEDGRCFETFRRINVSARK